MLQEAQLTNQKVNCASPVDLFELPYWACKTACDWLLQLRATPCLTVNTGRGWPWPCPGVGNESSGVAQAARCAR